MTTTPPELSIIVPALNDATELRGLLACLAQQTGVDFEVIICDGGSREDLQRLAAECCFPLRVITTERGRGIQMNAGAAVATGHTLLFLHADSRFDSTQALHSGLMAYKRHLAGSSHPCAARFKLRFRRSDTGPSLAYFYHEAKARLNRGNCIRGDQGYLIAKSIFDQLGCFDCSLPFLEDVRLAALIAGQGEWLLLPAEISTSARRFEQEGFYERQVANVIIVNAIETKWNELLSALTGLYQCSSTSGRLWLFPLLDGVRAMINNHDQTWRNSFWNATGAHVAANAWQIFFWLDVRHAFYSDRKADQVATRWLDMYEQRLKPLFHSRCAARLAKHLTRVWFWWILKTSKKSHTLTANNSG